MQSMGKVKKKNKIILPFSQPLENSFPIISNPDDLFTPEKARGKYKNRKLSKLRTSKLSQTNIPTNLKKVDIYKNCNCEDISKKKLRNYIPSPPLIFKNTKHLDDKRLSKLNLNSYTFMSEKPIKLQRFELNSKGRNLNKNRMMQDLETLNEDSDNELLEPPENLLKDEKSNPGVVEAINQRENLCKNEKFTRKDSSDKRENIIYRDNELLVIHIPFKDKASPISLNKFYEFIKLKINSNKFTNITKSPDEYSSTTCSSNDLQKDEDNQLTASISDDENKDELSSSSSDNNSVICNTTELLNSNQHIQSENDVQKSTNVPKLSLPTRKGSLKARVLSSNNSPKSQRRVSFSMGDNLLNKVQNENSSNNLVCGCEDNLKDSCKTLSLTKMDRLVSDTSQNYRNNCEGIPLAALAQLKWEKLGEDIDKNRKKLETEYRSINHSPCNDCSINPCHEYFCSYSRSPKKDIFASLLRDENLLVPHYNKTFQSETSKKESELLNKHKTNVSESLQNCSFSSSSSVAPIIHQPKGSHSTLSISNEKCSCNFHCNNARNMDFQSSFICPKPESSVPCPLCVYNYLWCSSKQRVYPQSICPSDMKCNFKISLKDTDDRMICNIDCDTGFS